MFYYAEIVNQFTVKENNNQKRFDVILFVNGLPLVFVELKSATDEKATLYKAYTQIQNYKTATPTIFYYNALCIISDGIDARTSSISAPFSRFLAWKAPKNANEGLQTELQTLTKYMLNKQTLLELIRYYTVFEQEERKYEKGPSIHRRKGQDIENKQENIQRKENAYEFCKTAQTGIHPGESNLLETHCVRHHEQSGR